MTSDTQSDSVSRWIAGIKADDQAALERLWERYFERVVALARRRLENSPRGASDEEDVALSVFDSLYRRAAAGKFQQLSTREELWYWLLALTRQKVVDRYRRDVRRDVQQIAGSSPGSVAAAGEPVDLQNLISDEPSPDFLVQLDDEFRRLMGLLRNDVLRRVAVWRMEGFEVAEIASHLGISVRAVERKLQLIRQKWGRELRA